MENKMYKLTLALSPRTTYIARKAINVDFKSVTSHMMIKNTQS